MRGKELKVKNIIEILNVLSSSASQQFKSSIGRPMFRFCVIAQPIIFGLLLGIMYLERTSEEFTVYALLGSGLATFWGSICFSSASDIHRERWYGTLETIYAAPVGFKWIVLGKIIGNSLWGLISIAISVTVVVIFFDKSITIASPIWLSLGFSLMTLSLIAIGYLLAALFTLSRNARVLMNFMEYPVYMLCGILFPLELIPVGIRGFSYLLSPTWAVKVLRYGVYGGTFHDVFPHLLGLSLISIAYLSLSVIMFERIDIRCRVEATLEVY